MVSYPKEWGYSRLYWRQSWVLVNQCNYTNLDPNPTICIQHPILREFIDVKGKSAKKKNNLRISHSSSSLILISLSVHILSSPFEDKTSVYIISDSSLSLFMYKGLKEISHICWSSVSGVALDLKQIGS